MQSDPHLVFDYYKCVQFTKLKSYISGNEPKGL